MMVRFLLAGWRASGLFAGDGFAACLQKYVLISFAGWKNESKCLARHSLRVMNAGVTPFSVQRALTTTGT